MHGRLARRGREASAAAAASAAARPLRRPAAGGSSPASTDRRSRSPCTGSAQATVSPSRCKQPDHQAVARGLEIEDRLGAVDLGQHLALVEMVAFGDVPFDDRGLGLRGALGRQDTAACRTGGSSIGSFLPNAVRTRSIRRGSAGGVWAGSRPPVPGRKAPARRGRTSTAAGTSAREPSPHDQRDHAGRPALASRPHSCTTSSRPVLRTDRKIGARSRGWSTKRVPDLDRPARTRPRPPGASWTIAPKATSVKSLPSV